jgi:hypothetical protein
VNKKIMSAAAAAPAARVLHACMRERERERERERISIF